MTNSERVHNCSTHKNIHEYFLKTDPQNWNWTKFKSAYGTEENPRGILNDSWCKSCDAISEPCDNACFDEHYQLKARGRRDFPKLLRHDAARTPPYPKHSSQSINIFAEKFNGDPQIRNGLDEPFTTPPSIPTAKKRRCSDMGSDGDKPMGPNIVDPTGPVPSNSSLSATAGDDGNNGPVGISKDSSVKEDTEPSIEFLLAEPTRTHFWKCFKAMDKEKKWRLKADQQRVVEDVLFEKFKNYEEKELENLLIASWILDPYLPINQEIFSDSELDEIIDSVDCLHHLYQWEDTIQKYFTTDTDCLEDLFYLHSKRKGLFESDEMDAQLISWIRQELARWLRGCENGSYNIDANEAYYTVKLWGSMFDDLLEMVPEWIVMRGETSSEASSARKNQSRIYGDNGRRLQGKFLDGVLVWKDQKIEYLAIEAAKQLKHGEQDEKHLKDWFGLARTLCDMLRLIHQKLGSDIAFEEKVQVLGTLEQGTHWTIIGLQQIGHVSTLRLHERLSVPSHKKHLQQFLEVLKTAISIRHTLEKLQTRISPHLLRWQRRRKSEIRIFACPDTPEGTKTKAGSKVKKDQGKTESRKKAVKQQATD